MKTYLDKKLHCVYKTTMDISTLRCECKKLRIDTAMDARGTLEQLSKSIGCNWRSLSMALSGHRSSKGSYLLLTKLKSYLLEQKANKANQ